MAASYIPLTDAACDAWTQNFSTKIAANPTLYGLIAPDAVAIAAVVDPFHDAYLLAGLSGTPPKTPLNPATRTPVTIANKDALKAAMLALVRIYALLIRNNDGVDDADKVDLGLTIAKTIPTPIPAPVTVPIIGLVSTANGVVTVSMRDSGTPTIRAKPFGAIAAEVYVAYSPTVPAGPLLANFFGRATKTPTQFSFGAGDANKLAWMWMRWITRTGLVGAYSDVLPFTVPTGGGT